MAYFEDMTPYSEAHGKVEPRAFHVGFLDGEHPYRQGAVEAALVDKMLHLVQQYFHATRGYYCCRYCDPGDGGGFPVELDGKELRLGSAEIMVPSNDDIIYRAPNLIVHYVRDHRYKPPDEFLTALEQLEITTDVVPNYKNPDEMLKYARCPYCLDDLEATQRLAKGD